MTKDPKVDRARRSLLKAVGGVAAAVAAMALHPRPGAAADDDRHCFRRGTRIRTANGYRRIETLRVGDQVIARFGGHVPIKDIGSFTLERPGPGKNWVGPSRPVRIKQGALGENVPAADLCLTASHAVFMRGFLVTVGDLVNGTSIVLETVEGHDTLDFFHIELAQHDLLDAEGAPCELLANPAVEPCVPLLGFPGGRAELRSRLRSLASIAIDRRQPLDVIRDDLEERGLQLARAA